MSQPQFEFTPKQDAEFRELVAKERMAAIAIAVLIAIKAAGSLGAAFSANWQAAMFALASFVAGIYACYALYISSQKFYKITQTNGKDMNHLFAGLQGLENCFTAMALAILFSIVPEYIGR